MQLHESQETVCFNSNKSMWMLQKNGFHWSLAKTDYKNIIYQKYGNCFFVVAAVFLHKLRTNFNQTNCLIKTDIFTNLSVMNA